MFTWNRLGADDAGGPVGRSVNFDTIASIAERYILENVPGAQSVRVIHIRTEYFEGAWAYNVDCLTTNGSRNARALSAGVRGEVMIATDGTVVGVKGRAFRRYKHELRWIRRELRTDKHDRP